MGPGESECCKTGMTEMNRLRRAAETLVQMVRRGRGGGRLRGKRRRQFNVLGTSVLVAMLTEKTGGNSERMAGPDRSLSQKICPGTQTSLRMLGRISPQ